jgi:uncharacterized protein (DUF433 family)
MSLTNVNQISEAEVAVVDEFRDRLSPRLNPDRPPITINPEKLGGTPTISGTRLPVMALIDHLLLGYDIDEFIDEFDGVNRGDVQAVLLKIKEALAEGWLAEAVDY